jgi:hypothetical protein
MSDVVTVLLSETLPQSIVKIVIEHVNSTRDSVIYSFPLKQEFLLLL